MFITSKHNTINMSQLWSQNSLRGTCNVFFVFNFIKHLFKWRDVLHIEYLVKNHIVLIWTIEFDLKQVKQKPCLYYLKSYKIFGILHLSRLQKHHHASTNHVYHQHFYLLLDSFIFSKKLFHWELIDSVLPCS